MEELACAVCGAGSFYKYDLSLPVGEMYSLVEQTRERMTSLPVTVRDRSCMLPADVVRCMHAATEQTRAEAVQK